MNSKLAILVGIIAGLLIGGAIAATYYLTIGPNTGTILTPATVTANPATIEWGAFYVTDLPKSQTVTLTNTGDAPTQPLHAVIVWITPISAALTITWDQEGQIIPAHSSIDATFWLEADPAPTYKGDFSFNIIIESAS